MCRPPRARVARLRPARRGCSPCGACSDWAVACMKRMIGPAWTVCTAHRIRSTTIGAISITRTRGTARSGDAQKARMPARVMAMSAASPDRISTTSNAHEAAGMAPPWRSSRMD